MKILHVISSLYIKGGGTSEMVPRLARAQKELGYEVTIAAYTVGDISLTAKEAFDIGVVNETNHHKCKFLSAIGLSSDLSRSLKRLIAEADVVQLHGLWMYPCWAAAWEAQRQGRPYFVMPHGFLSPERLKISKWKKRIIGWLIEKPILKRATGVIATAAAEVRGIRAYGYQGPIHIMPIGIDIDKFMMKDAGNKIVKTLLFLSRITPIKGLDMLAEAWSRVAPKDWKLLVVGPDDRGYTEEIKKVYAAKCAADSFEFRGPCYGEEKKRLLASADAFVLPTRSENWGIAVAEAMASGLPVLCTKGAPWGCINEAHSGWWCEISVDGIEGALRELISTEDDELARMGINGRRWVSDNLNWGKIASKLVSDIQRSL